MSNGKLELLTPDNCTLVLIDYQPQMVFAVASIERQLLIENVLGLARSARVFEVPTILTAVESHTFSGAMWPALLATFPGQPVLERSSMNAWEDAAVVGAVRRSGRKKLILAGLWTEVCVAFPAIEAIAAGYEVYFVADASGGTSHEAHQMAIQRMMQVGATPLTWLQVALEWQRDWARKDTYDEILAVLREHAGAYGQGIEYAFTMLPGAANGRGPGK